MTDVKNDVVATVYRDGKETTVTNDEIENTISNNEDRVAEIMEASYSIEGNENDVASLFISPGVKEIPISTGSGKVAFIKQGSYGLINNAYEARDDYETPVNDLKSTIDKGTQIKGGLLLIYDRENIVSSDIDVAPVRLFFGGEDEETVDAWALHDGDTGEFVLLEHVKKALRFLASVRLIVEDSADKDKPLILPGGKVFPHALRGKPRKKDITKVGSDHVANDGILAISAESNKAIEAALSSSKTFMQLNNLAMTSDYKYSHDRVCRVEASVSELLEDRDLDANDKNNRAKIRREVKSLGDGIRWTFEKTPGKGDFVTIPLAGGAYGVKGDHVVFSFSPDYMSLIANRAAGRIPTPKTLLTTDERRNPGSTSMGFKLVMHSYQNLDKENENTLSVRSLLESVNEIPTYDEVKNGDRHYDRRIISPMERNLNHLVEIGVINYWEYCHAKGEPLTDEEQDTRENARKIGAPLPYDIAINCNIQWELTEKYPEHVAKTLESREKKRLKAEAAKQRNEERQKRIDRKVESNIAKKIAEKEVEKRS